MIGGYGFLTVFICIFDIFKNISIRLGQNVAAFYSEPPAVHTEEEYHAYRHSVAEYQQETCKWAVDHTEH